MLSLFQLLIMTDFQIVRVQRMGQDRILTIPRHMIDNIKTDWMKVTISARGALVYDPVAIDGGGDDSS